jgi:NitT/TauT family transport system substrate-binding protein
MSFRSGFSGSIAACLMGIALLGTCQVQAQSAKPLVKVRYEEAVRSILYVPQYVALSQGFFKDAGLEVAMKTSQGTDKGMAALLSGSADIVLIGPEASIYVHGSESPVKPKIFTGLTATDGFMLMSRKPIDKFDWKMLKGKDVMSFRPGSNPDVFLETALRKHGLDPKKDLRLVNNVGPAARMGAWLSGQNDYVIFLEPEATMLEKDGKGYAVASIGAEVGMVDYTVFTTTDAYIKKNPEVIQAWTNAVARAQKYVNATPSAQLAKQIAEFFPGMPEAQIVTAVDRYKKLLIWKTTPMVEPAAMEKLQDMLGASGLLDKAKRVRYEDLVVTEFAKKAM